MTAHELTLGTVWRNVAAVRERVPLVHSITNFLNKIHGFRQYKLGNIERSKFVNFVRRYHHIVFDYNHAPDGIMLDEKSNYAITLWF